MITPESPWNESSSTNDLSADLDNSAAQNLDQEEIENEEALEQEEELEDEDSSVDSPKEKKRSRTARAYPAGSFSDALELGAEIHSYAGVKIRRLTLLEKMNRSANSGTTKTMITTSGKYGITKGSYAAEYLELTSEGQIIFDSSQPPRNVLKAKFSLAIEHIPPFKKLYDEYVGKRLAVPEVMRDFLKDSGEQIGDLKECIDLFVVNVKDLGLLRTIGGAQTLIPIAQAFEELPGKYVERNAQLVVVPKVSPEVPGEVDKAISSIWDSVCFYITPIGDEDSEQRKHSDLFLSSLVEPAVSELNLQVVRADQIGQQGLITAQIIEHIRCSRLVIVDLSFLNPNVFYEMALRHACKLPIVHLIRKTDQIPFDVSQSRCIIIDNTDIYSFVPNIQTYQSEIATQARKAIEDPEHRGNPITVFYPDFWNSDE